MQKAINAYDKQDKQEVYIGTKDKDNEKKEEQLEEIKKKTLIEKIDDFMKSVVYSKTEDAVDDKKKQEELNKRQVKTHKQFAEELQVGSNVKVVKPKTIQTNHKNKENIKDQGR